MLCEFPSYLATLDLLTKLFLTNIIEIKKSHACNYVRFCQLFLKNGKLSAHTKTMNTEFVLLLVIDSVIIKMNY